MRRRYLLGLTVIILFFSFLVSKILSHSFSNTLELSPFDPNAICLFWSETKSTPDPDTDENFTGRASFWMDIASGKVARAEGMHSVLNTFDYLDQPQAKLGSLSLDIDANKLGRDNEENQKIYSRFSRIVLQKDGKFITVESGSLGAVAWSADKSLVAFSVKTPDERLIEIADTDGKIRRRVVLANEFVIGTSAQPITWSADQKYLLVLLVKEKERNRLQEQADLLLIPVEGGNTHLYSTYRGTYIPNYDKRIDLPLALWSPVGHRFAIAVRQNSKIRIEIVDAETDNRQIFDPIEASWETWQLIWSPDGSAIVVSGTSFEYKGKNDWWLTVLNEDGTVEHVDVPKKLAGNGSFTWLKNSNALLYVVQVFSEKDSRDRIQTMFLWERAKKQSQSLFTYVNNWRFNSEAIFETNYEPDGIHHRVLDQDTLEFHEIGIGEYLLAWNDAMTHFAMVTKERTPNLTTDPEKQFVLTRYEVATGKKQSQVINGIAPKLQLPAPGSNWAMLHYRSGQNMVSFRGLEKSQMFDIDLTALFNVETGEYRPLGLGYILSAMYRQEQHISTQIYASNIARDFRYRSPYFMFAEPISRDGMAMQKYSLLGSEGYPSATFVVPSKNTLADVLGDYGIHEWFYVSLISPDKKHALFTNREDDLDNGQRSAYHLSRLYVGSDGNVPAKLVAGSRSTGWNDIRAMWSPDSQYFLVTREEEIRSQGGNEHHSYLEVYNADGTLRWQRIYKNFRSGVFNIWIQKCGIPYPMYWDINDNPLP